MKMLCPVLSLLWSLAGLFASVVVVLVFRVIPMHADSLTWERACIIVGLASAASIHAALACGLSILADE